mmetsp:Transcript_6483/g.11004  ORF Transcript_6483/g.11004 Transcript_6483/m.11004 type:complete len:106 (-) Transcript_6483:284-601(-)
MQKRLFYSHICFDPIETFREIDSEGKGFISVVDLESYFRGIVVASKRPLNFQRIITYLNASNTDPKPLNAPEEGARLTYVDFLRGVCPYKHKFQDGQEQDFLTQV